MTEFTSVNEFLSKHPMTHKKLASILGVSVDAVNNWSCGRRRISKQVLNHLSVLDERFTYNPTLRNEFVKDYAVRCTVA